MEPPYRLLHGVREVLGGYFGSFSPVEIAPGGLNVRTCCYQDDPTRLLVGLMNNDLFAGWRGTLRVRVGRIISARELTGDEQLRAGDAISLEIPAGDVAMLDVRIEPEKP